MPVHMTPPTTIVCADAAGPCELCGVECWALVDGRRVHSLTGWPMLIALEMEVTA